MDLNSLFNKDTRVFAFDDSPFSREDEFTGLIGVIMRKDYYIETLASRIIQVDGNDVTEKMQEMVEEKGSGVKVLMVQGTTFAGFNILDAKKLYGETSIPIINILDHEPDMAAIENALRAHFSDWEKRYATFDANFSRFGSLFIQSFGIEPKVAYKFSRMMTRQGLIPEPLRIADMVASIFSAKRNQA